MRSTKPGQTDNTIVVFTTDHGDMVGAHHMWIKGWIPYEECYRVPMIVRWPGHIQPGSQTSHLVQTHDLAHTYVAAAGAKPIAARGRKEPATALRESFAIGLEGRDPLRLLRRRIPLHAADRHHGALQVCIQWLRLRRAIRLKKRSDELRNQVENADFRVHADEMRERLYTLMNRFGDPYGEASAPPGSTGERPNRYGAPRYLFRRSKHV